MQSVWNRTPDPFQAEVTPLILQMIANDKVPEPILVVQPTSSGKSSVPQTVSVVCSGVTIILECTQALGSEQASKITQASKSNGALVHACQLDTYKTTQDRKAFASNMLSIMKEEHHSSIDKGIASFILFTSPEALLDPIWSAFLDDVLLIGMLTLLCIDEIHMFVEFGLSFRKEFIKLREHVFVEALITNNENISVSQLKVLTLCMAAKFNIESLRLLQLTMSVRFNYHCIFLNDKSQFRKRHVHIKAEHASKSKRLLRKILHESLSI